MSLFLHFHEIAAKRGDGLRPELVDILRRARQAADAIPISPAIERPAAPSAVKSADAGPVVPRSAA
ncbi:MAG: hypothetical protein E6Q76_12365 [Rhizobium sp.]|nr:MAG: hypothetical protein E6Q76_12365 [Rhizobium sp.]